MKKIIILLFILFITYCLVYIKIHKGTYVTCKLIQKNKDYQRNIYLSIYYKKNKIYKIERNENYTSSIIEYIKIEENNYQKNQFQINRTKNHVKAKKIEYVSKPYNKEISKIINSGYTCN